MIKVEIEAASNGFIVRYGKRLLVFEELEEALKAIALAVYPEHFKADDTLVWSKDKKEFKHEKIS